VITRESALLAVESLYVTYNRAAVALHGVSLTVPDGGIVAVLGANGAGKTTTLRAIGGMLRSEAGRISSGAITFRGQPIARKPPHWIARRGVAIVPERDKVFAELTVRENLSAVPVVHGHHRRREMEGFIFDLFPVLSERLKQHAGLLSGGERQMLAIARALLLEPQLMLADELSFGVAPVVLVRLREALRAICEERGVSVLLVEQNAGLVFDVADYVYFLDSGRVSLHGTSRELEGRDDIRRAYFGLETAVGGGA
jgi:branched-chain amino acid transport system ATP-binding protein